jgi:hypothetical protein
VVPEARALRWSDIRKNSYVLITAAEASGGAPDWPDRFVGDGRPIVIGNITPGEGFIVFVPWWHGEFPHLNIWTDFTILDR